MMTKDQLKQLQALDLDTKIMKTKARIREFINYFGSDNVYISFSGGKDSTVLLHLVRQEFPNVVGVFVNTGLEYPEIVDFVKKQENIEIIRPEKDFKTIIETKGVPVIGKEVANVIHYAKNGSVWALNRLKGLESDGHKRKESWKERYIKYAPLVNSSFKISDQCCNELKKKPFKKYEKATGKVGMIGMLAEESELRKTQYLKTGCNTFEGKNKKSRPLSFWLEKDILKYIHDNKIEIASVYGTVLQKDLFGMDFHCTGVSRTGCVFCLFGINHDKGENRIQRLKRTHPNLYNYVINTLHFGKYIDEVNQLCNMHVKY